MNSDDSSRKSRKGRPLARDRPVHVPKSVHGFRFHPVELDMVSEGGTMGSELVLAMCHSSPDLPACYLSPPPSPPSLPQLENIFRERGGATPKKEKCIEIVDSFNGSEPRASSNIFVQWKQIKTWFENRRQKEKRKNYPGEEFRVSTQTSTREQVGFYFLVRIAAPAPVVHFARPSDSFPPTAGLDLRRPRRPAPPWRPLGNPGAVSRPPCSLADARYRPRDRLGV